MLELRDVVKRYPLGIGEPVVAVDGVSLDVEAGEMVALCGPSGSGKSTLLMLVAALLRPDSGSIRVDGREVSMLTAREAAEFRSRELGYVRQRLSLLAGVSAIDNAALKLMGAAMTPNEAHRQVLPLLERLGLSRQVERRAEQLSMGERQRVLIARALSCDPKLVLADEPTASLDSVRGDEVVALLAELCRERRVAVLLVTHDQRAAAHADRVHVLLDGRLQGGGGPGASTPARLRRSSA